MKPSFKYVETYYIRVSTFTTIVLIKMFLNDNVVKCSIIYLLHGHNYI